MIELITDFDLRMTDEGWPFAEARRAEIAAHWAAAVAKRPALWDGRVLGTFRPRRKAGHFSAALVETSFSAFLAWRDWGFPDKGYFNLFGSAIIAGNDGGYIFGVMGEHTSNAGAIYPCGGTLEPRDVDADGRADIWASIARELREETGLLASDAEPGGDFLVQSGQLFSVNRVYRFDRRTAELAREIEANLATQVDRELAGIAVLHRLSDLDIKRTPAYAIEAARFLFGG